MVKRKSKKRLKRKRSKDIKIETWGEVVYRMYVEKPKTFIFLILSIVFLIGFFLTFKIDFGRLFKGIRIQKTTIELQKKK